MSDSPLSVVAAALYRACMGRQQAPGAQRLARLTRTPEPEPADLEPDDREPDDFEPDDLEPDDAAADDAAERWGATACRRCRARTS